MDDQIKSRFSQAQRSIAIFLLISFTLLNTSSNLYAETLPGSLPHHGISQADPKAILDSLKLPEELGSILEVYVPKGQVASSKGQGTNLDPGPMTLDPEKLIIYIQDAHANYDSESNIQKIIRHFQDEYQLPLVLLEGGEGKLDSLFFKSFPDQKAKEKLLDQYLRQGDLQGAEAASILNEDIDTNFYGIESQSLYNENKQAFLEATSKESEILSELTKQESELDQKAASGLTPQAASFLKASQSFRQEQMNLLEYVKALDSLKGQVASSKGQGTNLDPGPMTLDPQYPELSKLLQSEKNEKVYLGSEFDIATNELIEQFKSKVLPVLSKEDQTEIGGLIQDYKTAKLDRGFLVKRIEELSQRTADSVQRTENSSLTAERRTLNADSFIVPEILKPTAQHAQTLESIKGTKLFDELEALEDELRNILPQSDEEKDILQQYKELELLKSFAKLEITHKEWRELRTSNLEPRTSEQAATFDVQSPMFDVHKRFYQLALQRDEALLQNSLNIMDKEKAKVSVITTGGFHSEGIKQKLKEENIPFVLISPKINEIGTKDNYLNAMQGKRSFMKYYTTSLWDALAQDYAAKMAATLDERELTPSLKRWRDRIIQNSIAEGRITQAGNYTKYVDALIQALRKEYNGEASFVKREARYASRDTLHDEIDSFLDSYFVKLKNIAKQKIDNLSEGLKDLFAQKEISVKSVENLLNKINLPAKFNLQIPVVLADGPASRAELRMTDIQKQVDALRDAGISKIAAKKYAEEVAPGAAGEYAEKAESDVTVRAELRTANSPSQNKETVIKLFRRGLDDIVHAVGIHGTSIEAVQRLVETGFLPNGGRHSGALYFYPLKEGKIDVMENVTAYAQWNASKHFISGRLPFELDEKLFEGLSEIVGGGDVDVSRGDPIVDSFLDEAMRNGIDEDQILKWGSQATRSRRGVLILLSEKLKDAYKIIEDSANDERIINPQNGLPIEFIVGIEPLGDYEFKYLEDLEQKIENNNSLKSELRAQPDAPAGRQEAAEKYVEKAKGVEKSSAKLRTATTADEVVVDKDLLERQAEDYARLWEASFTAQLRKIKKRKLDSKSGRIVAGAYNGDKRIHGAYQYQHGDTIYYDVTDGGAVLVTDPKDGEVLSTAFAGLCHDCAEVAFIGKRKNQSVIGVTHYYFDDSAGDDQGEFEDLLKFFDVLRERNQIEIKRVVMVDGISDQRMIPEFEKRGIKRFELKGRHFPETGALVVTKQGIAKLVFKKRKNAISIPHANYEKSLQAEQMRVMDVQDYEIDHIETHGWPEFESHTSKQSELRMTAQADDRSIIQRQVEFLTQNVRQDFQQIRDASMKMKDRVVQELADHPEPRSELRTAEPKPSIDAETLDRLQRKLAVMDDSSIKKLSVDIILSPENLMLQTINQALSAEGLEIENIEANPEELDRIVVLEYNLRGLANGSDPSSLHNYTTLFSFWFSRYIQSDFMKQRIQALWKKKWIREDLKAASEIYATLEEIGMIESKAVGLPKGNFKVGENGRLVWNQYKPLSDVQKAASQKMPDGVELVTSNGGRGLYAVELSNVAPRPKLMLSPRNPAEALEHMQKMIDAIESGDTVVDRKALLSPEQVKSFIILLERQIQIERDVTPEANPDLPIGVDLSRNFNIPTARELRGFLNQILEMYDPDTGERRSELRTQPEAVNMQDESDEMSVLETSGPGYHVKVVGARRDKQPVIASGFSEIVRRLMHLTDWPSGHQLNLQFGGDLFSNGIRREPNGDLFVQMSRIFVRRSPDHSQMTDEQRKQYHIAAYEGEHDADLDEAKIAYILAHEMAHSVRKHEVLNERNDFWSLLSLLKSRKQEYEADRDAVIHLLQMGFGREEILSTMHKIFKDYELIKGGPVDYSRYSFFRRPVEWFSRTFGLDWHLDHPEPAQRITKAARVIAREQKRTPAIYPRQTFSEMAGARSVPASGQEAARSELRMGNIELKGDIRPVDLNENWRIQRQGDFIEFIPRSGFNIKGIDQSQLKIKIQDAFSGKPIVLGNEQLGHIYRSVVETDDIWFYPLKVGGSRSEPSAQSELRTVSPEALEGLPAEPLRTQPDAAGESVKQAQSSQASRAELRQIQLEVKPQQIENIPLRRILIVEDGVDYANRLKSAFENYRDESGPKGYQVQHVRTVEDALEIMQRGSFSIVALDYNLAGAKNGVDFLSEMEGRLEVGEFRVLWLSSKRNNVVSSDKAKSLTDFYNKTYLLNGDDILSDEPTNIDIPGLIKHAEQYINERNSGIIHSELSTARSELRSAAEWLTNAIGAVEPFIIVGCMILPVTILIGWLIVKVRKWIRIERDISQFLEYGRAKQSRLAQKIYQLPDEAEMKRLSRLLNTPRNAMPYYRFEDQLIVELYLEIVLGGPDGNQKDWTPESVVAYWKEAGERATQFLNAITEKIDLQYLKDEVVDPILGRLPKMKQIQEARQTIELMKDEVYAEHILKSILNTPGIFPGIAYERESKTYRYVPAAKSELRTTTAEPAPKLLHWTKPIQFVRPIYRDEFLDSTIYQLRIRNRFDRAPLEAAYERSPLSAGRPKFYLWAIGDDFRLNFLIRVMTLENGEDYVSFLPVLPHDDSRPTINFEEFQEAFDQNVVQLAPAWAQLLKDPSLIDDFQLDYGLFSVALFNPSKEGAQFAFWPRGQIGEYIQEAPTAKSELRSVNPLETKVVTLNARLDGSLTMKRAPINLTTVTAAGALEAVAWELTGEKEAGKYVGSFVIELSTPSGLESIKIQNSDRDSILDLLAIKLGTRDIDFNQIKSVVLELSDEIVFTHIAGVLPVSQMVSFADKTVPELPSNPADSTTTPASHLGDAKFVLREGEMEGETRSELRAIRDQGKLEMLPTPLQDANVRNRVKTALIFQPELYTLGGAAITSSLLFQAIRSTFPNLQKPIYAMTARDAIYDGENNILIEGLDRNADEKTQILKLVEQIKKQSPDFIAIDTGYMSDEHVFAMKGFIGSWYEQQKLEPPIVYITSEQLLLRPTELYIPGKKAVQVDALLLNASTLENYQEALRRLGFEFDKQARLQPSPEFRKQGEMIIRRALKLDVNVPIERPVIAVNPHGLFFGTQDITDRWALLIAQLIELEAEGALYYVVASGGPIDGRAQERVDKIKKKLETKIGRQADLPLLDPLNEAQLKSVLASSQAVISIQSGPAHIAEALGVPTIVWSRDDSGDRFLHPQTPDWHIVHALTDPDIDRVIEKTKETLLNHLKNETRTAPPAPRSELRAGIFNQEMGFRDAWREEMVLNWLRKKWFDDSAFGDEDYRKTITEVRDFMKQLRDQMDDPLNFQNDAAGAMDSIPRQHYSKTKRWDAYRVADQILRNTNAKQRMAEWRGQRSTSVSLSEKQMFLIREILGEAYARQLLWEHDYQTSIRSELRISHRIKQMMLGMVLAGMLFSEMTRAELERRSVKRSAAMIIAADDYESKISELAKNGSSFEIAKFVMDYMIRQNEMNPESDFALLDWIVALGRIVAEHDIEITLNENDLRYFNENPDEIEGLGTIFNPQAPVSEIKISPKGMQHPLAFARISVIAAKEYIYDYETKNLEGVIVRRHIKRPKIVQVDIVPEGIVGSGIQSGFKPIFLELRKIAREKVSEGREAIVSYAGLLVVKSQPAKLARPPVALAQSRSELRMAPERTPHEFGLGTSGYDKKSLKEEKGAMIERRVFDLGMIQLAGFEGNPDSVVYLRFYSDSGQSAILQVWQYGSWHNIPKVEFYKDVKQKYRVGRRNGGIGVWKNGEDEPFVSLEMSAAQTTMVSRHHLIIETADRQTEHLKLRLTDTESKNGTTVEVKINDRAYDGLPIERPDVQSIGARKRDIDETDLRKVGAKEHSEALKGDFPIDLSATRKRLSIHVPPFFITDQNGKYTVKLNPEFYNPLLMNEEDKPLLDEIMRRLSETLNELAETDEGRQLVHDAIFPKGNERLQWFEKMFDHDFLLQLFTEVQHQKFEGHIWFNIGDFTRRYLLDEWKIQTGIVAPEILEVDKKYLKYAKQKLLRERPYHRLAMLMKADPSTLRIAMKGEPGSEDPNTMVIDSIFKIDKGRPGLPGERVVLAKWKGRAFFLYISRSHTAKESEKYLHTWRSAEGMDMFGAHFIKQPIEGIDDLPPQISILLDEAVTNIIRRNPGIIQSHGKLALRAEELGFYVYGPNYSPPDFFSERLHEIYSADTLEKLDTLEKALLKDGLISEDVLQDSEHQIRVAIETMRARLGGQRSELRTVQDLVEVTFYSTGFYFAGHLISTYWKSTRLKPATFFGRVKKGFSKTYAILGSLFVAAAFFTMAYLNTPPGPSPVVFQQDGPTVQSAVETLSAPTPELLEQPAAEEPPPAVEVKTKQAKKISIPSRNELIKAALEAEKRNRAIPLQERMKTHSESLRELSKIIFPDLTEEQQKAVHHFAMYASYRETEMGKYGGQRRTSDGKLILFGWGTFQIELSGINGGSATLDAAIKEILNDKNPAARLILLQEIGISEQEARKLLSERGMMGASNLAVITAGVMQRNPKIDRMLGLYVIVKVKSKSIASVLFSDPDNFRLYRKVYENGYRGYKDKNSYKDISALRAIWPHLGFDTAKKPSLVALASAWLVASVQQILPANIVMFFQALALAVIGKALLLLSKEERKADRDEELPDSTDASVERSELRESQVDAVQLSAETVRQLVNDVVSEFSGRILSRLGISGYEDASPEQISHHLNQLAALPNSSEIVSEIAKGIERHVNQVLDEQERQIQNLPIESDELRSAIAKAADLDVELSEPANRLLSLIGESVSVNENARITEAPVISQTDVNLSKALVDLLRQRQEKAVFEIRVPQNTDTTKTMALIRDLKRNPWFTAVVVAENRPALKVLEREFARAGGVRGEQVMFVSQDDALYGTIISTNVPTMVITNSEVQLKEGVLAFDYSRYTTGDTVLFQNGVDFSQVIAAAAAYQAQGSLEGIVRNERNQLRAMGPHVFTGLEAFVLLLADQFRSELRQKVSA